MSSNLIKQKDNTFLIVLAFALICGMVVALVLCGFWRYHPSALAGNVQAAAIAVCPPLLLAGVFEATTDSTLALVITLGTIVFANAFLYGGLASLAYFFARVLLRRSH